MVEPDDHELLAEFARSESEAAFATLVARYVNLVYSTALRFTRNSHHAEEITQAVFIILARKAGKLSPRIVLSGWLYQTARFTAANLMKGEIRRQRREQEAYMQSTLNEPDKATWEQIAPLLDEAMGRLGETDRNAVVLRFFQNKTAAEAAIALKLSEAAAHKRLNRALEKLRKFFTKRGVTSTTAVIAGAISVNSVQAAPVGLAATITVTAVKGSAVAASTLTLIQGALKVMAWTKAKTIVVVGAAMVLAVGTTTPIVVHYYRANASIFTSVKELSYSDSANYETLTGATPEQVARTFLGACSQEDWTEAAKYWWSDPHNNRYPSIPDGLKQRYGGLEIIRIGKPFKARISIARLIELQPESRNQFKGMPLNGDFAASGVFVPYEMRLKDGTIRKWQLSIRCDNPDHRWYYDGGL